MPDGDSFCPFGVMPEVKRFCPFRAGAGVLCEQWALPNVGCGFAPAGRDNGRCSMMMASAPAGRMYATSFGKK